MAIQVKLFEHSIATAGQKEKLQEDINAWLAENEHIQLLGPVAIAFSDERDRVISLVTYQA